MSKTREEVNADFKAASITQDAMERRRIQSETLSAVFGTYFRILKRTMQPIADRSEWGVNSIPGASGCHALLAPCLDGIGKFYHLIDLDFMGDLLNYLRKLA
ncbi:nucleolar complex-associated protein 3-like [Cornus florida]|uniref:nucleolar complex-associated protein 3-like n=1 Tax=Cornus florida TaxID=4283 RepID=UPI00289DF854|nr:nucleolar complex-associated protein 3-like [Cornus florida]